MCCSSALSASGDFSLSGSMCCLSPAGKVKCSEAALQCQNDNQQGSRHKNTPSVCVSAFSTKWAPWQLLLHHGNYSQPMEQENITGLSCVHSPITGQQQQQ